MGVLYLRVYFSLLMGQDLQSDNYDTGEESALGDLVPAAWELQYPLGRRHLECGVETADMLVAGCLGVWRKSPGCRLG